MCCLWQLEMSMLCVHGAWFVVLAQCSTTVSPLAEPLPTLRSKKKPDVLVLKDVGEGWTKDEIFSRMPCP